MLDASSYLQSVGGCMMTRPVFDDRPQLDMAVTHIEQMRGPYALVVEGGEA